MKYYAGIGSRDTPRLVLDVMADFAGKAAEKHWCLRSGNAEGADQAFHQGSLVHDGEVEIYLPWPKFNSDFLRTTCQPGMRRPYIQDYPTARAIEMAVNRFPWVGNLKESVISLVSRNMHQILGKNLDSPVSFVICWAPILNATTVRGGTNYAVQIAHDWSIPVKNLILPQDMKWALAQIKQSSSQ